jgi:ABC-2 type transport system permease protein
VAVREVFEAQTLANFFRFPMVFLCGVFVPLAAMPPALRLVARFLPLTYAVEALRGAIAGATFWTAGADLLALGGFAVALFALAARILATHLD